MENKVKKTMTYPGSRFGEKMDVVFILDRSGSMHGMEEDTIGGFNGYIKASFNQNNLLTAVLFDDKYEMIYERETVKNVKPLTKDVYYTRGCTALMDAIGKTIKYLDEKDTKKVLFIITTDGLENASKEYNKSQIKELIEGHSNWEFLFLGANIDSYTEAGSIGIKQDRTSNFSKTREGMDMMFQSVRRVSAMYQNDGVIKENWKDELENYIENNKK